MQVNAIGANRSRVTFSKQKNETRAQLETRLAEVAARIKESIKSGNGIEPRDHNDWHYLSRRLAAQPTTAPKVKA